MWGLFSTIISVPILLPIVSHIWIEKVGVDFDEIQSSPLYWMENVPHTYSALLGNSQADDILYEYNPLLNSSSWDSYEGINAVFFPLIYPETLKYLPLEVSWLGDKTYFSKHEKKCFDRDHLIFVFRAENGKAILAYYKHQKLKLATYVSLWDSHKARTISWIYRIYHREIDHRSTMYNDDPMPYALQYTWAYYLHYWESDWTDLSHGCIRVPWLYQKWLYENLPWDWQTTIIIHRPYEITLKKE
jgi:hypothetical protein